MGSMRNHIIPVGYLFFEEESHVNNQQHKNSIQNHSNSERIVEPINILKKVSMTPTPLYVSLFFLQS